MVVEEPTPIDPKRAKDGFVYFAKEYLETELTTFQIELIETFTTKMTIPHRNGNPVKDQAITVALAFARHRGFEIEETNRKPIDL
jgi:hypothetical protein